MSKFITMFNGEWLIPIDNIALIQKDKEEEKNPSHPYKLLVYLKQSSREVRSRGRMFQEEDERDAAFDEIMQKIADATTSSSSRVFMKK